MSDVTADRVTEDLQKLFTGLTGMYGDFMEMFRFVEAVMYLTKLSVLSLEVSKNRNFTIGMLGMLNRRPRAPKHK